MTTLLGKNASLDRGGGRSALARIFRSIHADLEAVEAHLAAALRTTRDPAVREIIDFLLESPAKRIRPALVLLCARTVQATAFGPGSVGATHASGSPTHRFALGTPSPLHDVAAAVELIHMASLVHDDLIDGATVRHRRASVPAKWGRRVAVSTGDHLCAKAFQLMADAADPRLFAVLGAQMAAMCEGELQQVARRGDFGLGEHHCLAMIEKKTASLFQACCGAGALVAGGEPKTCQALEEFGFHLGIAFQLLDDCRDLLSDRAKLGKTPGQDLRAGDVTLPLVYAMRHAGRDPCPVIRALGVVPRDTGHEPRVTSHELARLGEAFRSSPAPDRIAELVESCIARAKQQLQPMADSDFKISLHLLANHMAGSVSGILAG